MTDEEKGVHQGNGKHRHMCAHICTKKLATRTTRDHLQKQQKLECYHFQLCNESSNLKSKYAFLKWAFKRSIRIQIKVSKHPMIINKTVDSSR